MTGTALDIAEQAIAKAASLPQATRTAIFTRFDPDRIRAEAARLDERHRAGEGMPLYGLTISVKDLFDEEGEVTTAGSRLLRDRAPASRDSAAVARLRQAGALCVGRSSMTEFAYSGVGLNPHHGTPESVFGGGLIPGGSTAGGAVAVALGITDAALGSDTGGSCRIPAAANGLWGFKPTQNAVSRDGTQPLAPSFDTVGVIAARFEQLVACFAALSGREAGAEPPPEQLHLAVPHGAFTNELDEDTAQFFALATDRIGGAGHRLTEIDLTPLHEALWVNRALVAHEALAQYGGDLDRLAELGDPRVLSRIRHALTLSDADVSRAYATRAEMVALFTQALDGFDALVSPTLAQALPTIAAVEADFDTLNARMLRNPSLVNLADGCSLAMPTGDGPRSLMISAPAGADFRLLGVAERLRADGLAG